MNQKLRPITAFLSFVLGIVVLVALLFVLNWFPRAIEGNILREFTGVEQVKSTLQIAHVYVPSYFPENITWPPSKILAQDKPFPALLMEFKKRGTDQVVLVLSQSRGGTIRSDNSLEPAVIRETVPFSLHNSEAIMTVGECRDRDVCSSITWSEDGYALTASMKSTPFELRKIAESMHRR